MLDTDLQVDNGKLSIRQSSTAGLTGAENYIEIWTYCHLGVVFTWRASQLKSFVKESF